MRWLPWRRTAASIPDVRPLDVDALLHQVRTDPSRLAGTYARLREHRSALVRRRKALARQGKHVTPTTVRRVGRYGPQVGSYLLEQDVRASQDQALDQGYAGQVAEVERQIEAIDQALYELRTLPRR